MMELDRSMETRNSFATNSDQDRANRRAQLSPLYQSKLLKLESAGKDKPLVSLRSKLQLIQSRSERNVSDTNDAKTPPQRKVVRSRSSGTRNSRKQRRSRSRGERNTDDTLGDAGGKHYPSATFQRKIGRSKSSGNQSNNSERDDSSKVDSVLSIFDIIKSSAHDSFNFESSKASTPNKSKSMSTSPLRKPPQRSQSEQQRKPPERSHSEQQKVPRRMMMTRSLSIGQFNQGTTKLKMEIKRQGSIRFNDDKVDDSAAQSKSPGATHERLEQGQPKEGNIDFENLVPRIPKSRSAGNLRREEGRRKKKRHSQKKKKKKPASTSHQAEGAAEEIDDEIIEVDEEMYYAPSDDDMRISFTENRTVHAKKAASTGDLVKKSRRKRKDRKKKTKKTSRKDDTVDDIDTPYSSTGNDNSQNAQWGYADLPTQSIHSLSNSFIQDGSSVFGDFHFQSPARVKRWSKAKSLSDSQNAEIASQQEVRPSDIATRVKRSPRRESESDSRNAEIARKQEASPARVKRLSKAKSQSPKPLDNLARAKRSPRRESESDSRNAEMTNKREAKSPINALKNFGEEQQQLGFHIEKDNNQNTRREQLKKLSSSRSLPENLVLHTSSATTGSNNDEEEKARLRGQRYSSGGKIRNVRTNEEYTGFFIASTDDKNLKHGFGITKFPEGQIFEGLYEKGDMVQGKMTYLDGSTYVGKFDEAGLRCGKGIYTTASTTFLGEFHKDQQHGSGILIYHDDDSNKSGTTTNNSGQSRRFIGHWKEGRMHGYGRVIYTDGTVLKEGRWKDGFFLRESASQEVLAQM